MRIQTAVPRTATSPTGIGTAAVPTDTSPARPGTAALRPRALTSRPPAVALLALLGAIAAVDPSLGAERPRLAVVVVAGGLRPEALAASEDAAAPGEGLARVVRGGIRFLNVRIDHAVTSSGPGHAALSTGASPSGHGIVLDGWIGGASPRRISAVESPGAALVVPGSTVAAGAAGEGRGPSLLECSTLADELVAATDGRAKAWSVAEDPSGAVLTAGRLGKALWLSAQGGVASSTAYFPRRGAFPPRLPRWVEEVAAGASFASRSAADRVVDIAVAAIREEALGADDAPDVLWVSFRVDAPGERLSPAPKAAPTDAPGPGAPATFGASEDAGTPAQGGDDAAALGREARARSTDAAASGPEAAAPSLAALERAVSRLLASLDALGGGTSERPYVLLLVADHGSPGAREDLAERGFPSGTLDPDGLAAAVKTALDRGIRPLDWVLGARPGGIWLNPRAVAASRRGADEVEATAAEALRGAEGVLEVWTKSRVARGEVPDTETARRVRRSFHPERFPSLLVVPRPYFVWRGEGGRAISASPHAYDTHVPLVAFGPGIEPARVSRRVSLVDVAPTLAVLLGAGLPSACEGEPIAELVDDGR